MLVLASPVSALNRAANADFQAISTLLLQAGAADEKVRRMRSKVSSTKEDISSAERQRNSLMNQAIRKTLKAYGVVPLRQDGSLDMPRSRSAFEQNPGELVHYTPVFDPGLAADHWALTRSLPVHLRGSRGEGRMAYSMFKGHVVVYEIPIDPRYLALVLYHERVHFEQLTDETRANLPVPENEQRALEATFAAISIAGYGPSDHAIRKELSDAISASKAKGEKERSIGGRARSLAMGIRRGLRGVLAGYQADFTAKPQTAPAPPALRLQIAGPVPDEVQPLLPTAGPAADEAAPILPTAPPAPPEAPPLPPPADVDDVIDEPPDRRRRGPYDPCIEPGNTCFR